MLKEKGITISDLKVNYIIKTVRDNLYPKDEDFINNISSCLITLDEKLNSAQNLHFCPVYTKFVNSTKKNRQEKYINFTTPFHLKFLKKSKYVFVDEILSQIQKHFINY